MKLNLFFIVVLALAFSFGSSCKEKTTHGKGIRLEDIFEERVSKALNKLGVPSSKDIDVLIARIEELNRSVAKLSAKSAAAPRAAANGAAKPATKRATARKSA